MADYTDLPNTAVGVGGIPSGTTVTALRDNPIAIAEGAAGAPRVEDGALDTGAATAAGITWVGLRTAGASVGGVGTYLFAFLNTGAGFPYNAGSTVAGSLLRPSNARATDQVVTISGTWRIMGFADDTADNEKTTLFLRIS